MRSRSFGRGQGNDRDQRARISTSCAKKQIMEEIATEAVATQTAVAGASLSSKAYSGTIFRAERL